MRMSRRDIWGLSLILGITGGLVASGWMLSVWAATAESWLPRVGCFMVAAGALVGADLQVRYRAMRKRPTGEEVGYVAWVERLELFSLFVLVVLGTLIWGFGDLIQDMKVAQ